MSGKKNYAARQKAAQQAVLEIGEELGMQKMWDYVQSCLHDPEIMKKDTFGKERMTTLFEGLKKKADLYAVAFTDDKEADYYQEKLDADLREIWGDDFQPFEMRYPYVRQFGYDKARKGWK